MELRTIRSGFWTKEAMHGGKTEESMRGMVKLLKGGKDQGRLRRHFEMRGRGWRDVAAV